MANITRYNPVDDAFDNVFRNFWAPLRMEGLLSQPSIKLDVTDNESAYTVQAEIPGVKKEDINVSR